MQVRRPHNWDLMSNYICIHSKITTEMRLLNGTYQRLQGRIMLTCHPMARSVRHCRASPSGSLMGRDCRATNRFKIVSMRGRRDLMQIGQRNFVSFRYVIGLPFSPEEGLLVFTIPFIKGTQPTATRAHLLMSLVHGKFVILSPNSIQFFICRLTCTCI